MGSGEDQYKEVISVRVWVLRDRAQRGEEGGEDQERGQSRESVQPEAREERGFDPSAWAGQRAGSSGS